jgi:hypothetical protein
MFEPINCRILKAYCVGVKRRTYDTCSYMIMSSHKSVLFSRPVAEASSLGNNPCQSIQSVNHGLLLHEIYQGNAPPPLLKPFSPSKFQMYKIRIYSLFYLMKLTLCQYSPPPKCSCHTLLFDCFQKSVSDPNHRLNRILSKFSGVSDPGF